MRGIQPHTAPHRRFSTSSTRTTKRAALLSTLETGIRELYARQLSMLCARALKSYKAALVRLLDGDMLGEESEANVLRQVGSSLVGVVCRLLRDVYGEVVCGCGFRARRWCLAVFGGDHSSLGRCLLSLLVAVAVNRR